MISVKEFEEMARNSEVSIIPPNYVFNMHNVSIFSLGYTNCVGVVLAGKVMWAQSHYPEEGTQYQVLVPRISLAGFAGSKGLYEELGPQFWNLESPPPSKYIPDMVEFLGLSIAHERKEDLIAKPFGGNEAHLQEVIRVLDDQGIPSEEPERKHFSDAEMGGAEGQILSLPSERRILYHQVSKNRILEFRL